MFGLFHCYDNPGKPQNKAEAWYEILNDDLDKHTHISAGDKDLKPAFKKMCALVTTELFDLAHLKIQYSTADKKKLVKAAEELLDGDEGSWLDAVYGSSSTQVNAKWLEKVTSDGKWIFDATYVRAKLFELAQVQVKHMK